MAVYAEPIMVSKRALCSTLKALYSFIEYRESTAKTEAKLIETLTHFNDTKEDDIDARVNDLYKLAANAVKLAESYRDSKDVRFTQDIVCTWSSLVTMIANVSEYEQYSENDNIARVLDKLRYHAIGIEATCDRFLDKDGDEQATDVRLTEQDITLADNLRKGLMQVFKHSLSIMDMLTEHACGEFWAIRGASRACDKTMHRETETTNEGIDPNVEPYNSPRMYDASVEA